VAHHRVNPYPGNHRQNETEMFSDHDKTSPYRSSFSSVGSLFHTCRAATKKALSSIRRCARGTTRLPHDEVSSVDRPGIRATNVRRSEIYSSVSQKRPVNQQAQLVLDPLNDWQPVQHSKSWSHMITRLEIKNGVCRCVQLAGTVPAWNLEDRPARRCNSPDVTGQVL